MRKKFPVLKTDEEAEAFLEQDLTDYLHAGNFKPMPFEFRPKGASVNLRISPDLLNAVRTRAQREGIPYQRYIRRAIERALDDGLPEVKAAAPRTKARAKAPARAGK